MGVGDTASRREYYEPATGTITDREVVVDVHDEGGVPDGMTVDTEGYVWSARWNGGCLVRYNPPGDEVDRIEIPARKTSRLSIRAGSHPDYGERSDIEKWFHPFKMRIDRFRNSRIGAGRSSESSISVVR